MTLRSLLAPVSTLGRRRRSTGVAAAELIRQRWAVAALGTTEVGLAVRDGVVTLRGTVADAGERDRVEAAARGPGVRRIDNQLTVGPDRAATA